MTDALNITPEQRDILRAILSQCIPGRTVLAYGSRVKGTARSNSDLDLVVLTPAYERPLVSELKEALDESNLPFLVDVLVWDEVPESFHCNIAAGYVVLQQGTQTTLPKSRLDIDGESLTR